MQIGIVYCAYNCKKFTEHSISTLIEAKDKKLISTICAVSIPFFEYFDIRKDEDGTTEYLLSLYKNNYIDNIFTTPNYIKEHKARDMCLQYLKIMNNDIIWMIDADELYTIENIKNIVSYINTYSNFYWYKINFKNYVFDGKQWVDGFCPPRIFRTKVNEHIINEFYWDNDISYKAYNKVVNYKDLKNLEIPKDIAHVKHMTWLHENGKEKYEYQMKHFGHCGYKWNYNSNRIELNNQFYLTTNQEIPIINHE